MWMSRPPITQRVIEGILESTNEHLAGGDENMIAAGVTENPEKIARANKWARDMREWMRSRGTWKEDKSETPAS